MKTDPKNEHSEHGRAVYDSAPQTKRLPTAREHYHQLLDRAMDATREGESFLPHFVRIVLEDR